MTRSWAGFTASIPQRGCCLEGGKGGHTFFGSSCRSGFFHTHGLLETGGLTRFLMRFDDERARETMAGRSCLFFFFCQIFFFKMHHDGDAKRLGSIDVYLFSIPLIITIEGGRSSSTTTLFLFPEEEMSRAALLMMMHFQIRNPR